MITNSCKLEIRWKVHFLKSVWVKGLIEKNAKTATEEALRGWIVLAKKWLQEEQELNADVDNTENNVLLEKDSTKFDSPDESNETLLDSPQKTAVEQKGLADTNFEVPILEIPIPVKAILLLTVIFSFIICGGILLSYIHSVESEIEYWENSAHEIEHRILFLNLFASHLVDHASNHHSSLEEEWDYWKRTRGLDWRLAEWQEQMFTLKSKLSEALGEVSHVLDAVSSPRKDSDPDKLLNERTLRSLVIHTDHTKVRILYYSVVSLRF